jgi:uncharacterized protein involved in high-affinity Fe2+ transport
MKKIITMSLAVGFFIACLGSTAMAQLWKKAAPAPEVRASQTEVILERAVETLKSMEWVVYITPIAVKGQKKTGMETDVLTFTDNKIKSKNLSAQGYGESNYMPTLADDGSVVFDTMQMNEKGDKVFFRVVLTGRALGGIISMRPKGGVKRVFNFSSEMLQETIAPVTVTTTKKK